MITINLTIDKRRCKKDGTYPLVFRLTLNSSSRDLATKYSILESDWNSRLGVVKDTHPLYSIIAPRIKELEIFYLTKAAEYQKLYPRDNNIQRIKDYIKNVDASPVTVYSYWKDEITLLHTANRNGGALVYELSLAAISKVKSLNIPFEQVDYVFLRVLEAQLISNGLAINSIGVHMRSLRAIYNKAIKSKIVSKEYYPFESYKIKKQATTPRPITADEVYNYFNLQLDKKSGLYDSWLLGKLIFMLMGINYHDVILLNESNIINNRLCYIRSKTKTEYSIKMLQDVVEIFDYFKGRDTNTLLGKLTKEDLDNKKRLPLVIKQHNKTFNKHLNKLGNMIGCETKLSSYSFRYSWANIGRSLGFNVELLAQGLGHKMGNKITLTYLNSFDTELVDNMNHVIHLTVSMPKTTSTES